MDQESSKFYYKSENYVLLACLILKIDGLSISFNVEEISYCKERWNSILQWKMKFRIATEEENCNWLGRSNQLWNYVYPLHDTKFLYFVGVFTSRQMCNIFFFFYKIQFKSFFSFFSDALFCLFLKVFWRYFVSFIVFS